jgi:hypothetical protein
MPPLYCMELSHAGNKKYFTVLTGSWNNSSCITYSRSNDIPIWSIAYQYAQSIPGIDSLATSGLYLPTADLGQMDQAYYACLQSMNARLRNVYTLTWRSSAVTGDSVEVRVTVTYSNPN